MADPTGAQAIWSMFLILACVAFVSDIFDTAEGNIKKAIVYSAGVVAVTILCVSLILGAI